MVSATVDLEVVIASHRDERWLEPCLRSLAAGAGDCTYRATIVENGGAPLSLREAPERLLYTENRGFAAANNAGARGSAADILLFLNPDTELARGTLELLVTSLREQPEVGLLAVRQVTSDGRLWPSLHRFPSPRRALAGALGNEQWPALGKRLGERVLDMDRYSRIGPFDWTTGAALAVRREAFEAARGFDERFFLFSEETDLCKRIQDLGWKGASSRASLSSITPARQACSRGGRRRWRTPASSTPESISAARAPPPTTRSSSSTTCCGSRYCASGAPPARQARRPRNSRSAYCSAHGSAVSARQSRGAPHMEAFDGE